MPIEQRGVDTIPDEERTSGPRDLVSILLGSNLCLGVIIFGWLPPSFGLGWWASVSSVVAGTGQFGRPEEQQPVTFGGGQSHDTAPPCLPQVRASL